ncbi:cadherin-like domain-containing protein [Okeania sp.]|uniref:cadherin-like domain-containing protein n=1 Tax=Okeania sp. TaxID=3100323 RepID=UPI002B4B01E5|nr:cadherin-like domain-containing protein [Okeania sp.]MEB3340664.1 cadherin-like domain-containing protein [Okeania sp.]
MAKTTKSQITKVVDNKGGLDPDIVDVTIVPGDDVTIDITANVTKNSSTKQPLDLVFLADLSGSYSDDLPVLRDLVPKLVSSVRDVQPNSQFGLASYVDKPKSPFGNSGSGDYVYKTEQELTKSKNDFQDAMDSLKTRVGGDFPESQLEALMQVALREEEVGYRKNSRKVVVLSTDADYHEAGDGKKGGITTPNNGDAVLDGTPAGTGEDYPSVAQVRDALQEAGVVPIFAVTSNQKTNYEKLVDKLGFGAVEVLSRDSSNLVKVVTNGLEEIFSDLTMVSQSDDFGYVKKIKPATYENVRSGESRTFEVTLGTKDMTAGEDSLSLEVLGYGETVVNVSTFVNTDPVARNDKNKKKLTTDEGKKLIIRPGVLLANDTDADGDKLSITKVSNADNGKVKLAKNGKITFTPDKNFSGNASFEYIVDDGNGGTDTAKVTVKVEEGNNKPVAKDDATFFFWNKARTIEAEDLLENDKDKDGDKLTITKVSKPTNGTVKLDKKSGEITFTPDTDVIKGSFEYTISDGKGGRDTAKVELGALGDRSAIMPRSAKVDDLTGAEEGERFVYDDLLDAGNNITNFEVGDDIIVLSNVLGSVGYEGSDAIADEYVRVVSKGAGAMVQIDPDGPEGPEGFAPFLSVRGVTAEVLNDSSNFAF